MAGVLCKSVSTSVCVHFNTNGEIFISFDFVSRSLRFVAASCALSNDIEPMFQTLQDNGLNRWHHQLGDPIAEHFLRECPGHVQKKSQRESSASKCLKSLPPSKRIRNFTSLINEFEVLKVGEWFSLKTTTLQICFVTPSKASGGARRRKMFSIGPLVCA